MRKAASTILLFAAACGAHARPAEAPRPRTACVVGGVANRLAMSVPGVPDVLEVSSYPAEVRLLDADRAEARVIRPLAFAGSAVPRDIEAAIGAAALGPISLYVGAAVRGLTPNSDGWQATVVLSGPAELEADWWQGVAVRTAVPCGSLSLGLEHFVLPSGPIEGGPSHMIVGAQDVSLFASPGGPLVGQLAVTGPGDAFHRGVRVVETRAGLAHVRQEYAYGALDVWLDEERLGPTPMGFTMGLSSAGTGGHGCAGGGATPVYVGPARIHAGTEVVAGSTGIAWGLFVEDTEVVVSMGASGPVELVELRGIESVRCGNLEPELAMVPREALQIPK